MRTLVYKRTHTGDPDSGGRFGINGCMGRVRNWPFDAVIGVGGIGPEATTHGIDGRVTWIGIGPHRHRGRDRRGPVLTFDHFLLFDATGPFLIDHAPRLAEHLYGKNVRTLLHSTTRTERREIDGILLLAKNAPASLALSKPEAAQSLHGCAKHHKHRCLNCHRNGRRIGC